VDAGRCAEHRRSDVVPSGARKATVRGHMDARRATVAAPPRRAQAVAPQPHYSEAIKSWIRSLEPTSGAAKLPDHDFGRNQRASHYRMTAICRNEPVDADYQTLGLADGLVAGSMTGRGWSSDWSFEGRWEDHQYGDVWHLLFLLRPADQAVRSVGGGGSRVSCEVEGTIIFNVPDGSAQSCPAGHRSRERFVRRAAVGCSTAVEMVRGWYDSAGQQFHVLGIDVCDPGLSQQLPPALGLDNYMLTVSPDGTAVTGCSRGNGGDWGNVLEAVCVESLLAVTRRQSLAWATSLHARLSVGSFVQSLAPDLIEKILVLLYVSGKNTMGEVMEDHAGRRCRVALAKRALLVAKEGVPQSPERA
jgi:hypothetical protein